MPQQKGAFGLEFDFYAAHTNIFLFPVAEEKNVVVGLIHVERANMYLFLLVIYQGEFIQVTIRF